MGPPPNVDDAVFVWRILPPVMVIPWVEESPAVAIPPLNVEVALEVLRSVPARVAPPVD